DAHLPVAVRTVAQVGAVGTEDLKPPGPTARTLGTLAAHPEFVTDRAVSAGELDLPSADGPGPAVAEFVPHVPGEERSPAGAVEGDRRRPVVTMKDLPLQHGF